MKQYLKPVLRFAIKFLAYSVLALISLFGLFCFRDKGTDVGEFIMNILPIWGLCLVATLYALAIMYIAKK